MTTTTAPPTVGEKIQNFTAQTTNNKTITLNDLKGKNVILYFYPKDDTPGCTLEGQDFRDNYETFQQLNTEIYGISRDNLNQHEKFKTKHNFPFELITDPEETLCHQFDVIKMKNMYGKQIRGIERSTFLIDKDGTLKKEWRKVKVKDHIQELLTTLKS